MTTALSKPPTTFTILQATVEDDVDEPRTLSLSSLQKTYGMAFQQFPVDVIWVIAAILPQLDYYIKVFLSECFHIDGGQHVSCICHAAFGHFADYEVILFAVQN